MNDRERALEARDKKLVDNIDHLIETVIRDMRRGSDAADAIDRINARDELASTLKERWLTP